MSLNSCDLNIPSGVRLLANNVEVDSDGDGLSDLYEENVSLTSPTGVSTLNDGIPDGWKAFHGFDPLDSSVATNDADNDGLTNLQEYQHGTDPRVADTDRDGLADGAEVLNGWNPLKTDTDGDGIPDGWKAYFGLNSSSATNALHQWGTTGMTYWDLWLAGANTNTLVQHLYVNTLGGSGTNSTIQAAINMIPMNSGTLYVVHVSPGSYPENLILSNQNYVMILGTNASHTIVSGTSTNQSVISATGFLSLNIRGLTIQNGKAQLNGGGIMADSSNGALRVSNCIITNNSAQSLGGGIWCQIETNQNLAEELSMSVLHTQSTGSNSVLLNVISDCSGPLPAQSALGWDLPSNQSEALANQYETQAASIPPSAIFNCIIAGNQADDGPAVLIYSGTLGILHDTIVTNTSFGGYAIRTFLPQASCVIFNSILWKNGWAEASSLKAYSSVVAFDNYTVRIASITNDPQLVSEFLGDLHLRHQSPARGMAWPSKLLDDIDGEARQICTNQACDDVGADHYVDANNDGIPDYWESQYGVTGTNDYPVGNGLTYLQTYTYGTNPNTPDTDGDGYSDAQEVFFGANPLDPISTPLIPADLVAWWPLDEGEGTNTLDASGNGQTGIIITNSTGTQPAWTTNSISLNALAFDGSGSGWVGVPGIPNGGSFRSFTTGLTVSAWVQMPTTAPSGIVVAKWGISASSQCFQMAAGGGQASFETLVATNSLLSAQDVLVSGTLTNDGLWHLITGTFNGAEVDFYVDGIYETNQLVSGANSQITNTTTTLNILIGRRSGFATPFTGTIDDVRIYNRALSGCEIFSLYNMDTDGDGMPNILEANVYQTNPNVADSGNYGLFLRQMAGWWTFDESSGTTASDSSGNGNTGTLISMVGTNHVGGHIGNAFLFDGSASEVSVPPSGTTCALEGVGVGSVTDELSVAAWINLDANGATSQRTIFSLGSKTNSQPWAGAILSVSNSQPMLTVFLAPGQTNQFAVIAPNIIPTNEWHHVAGVYSSSRQTMVVYLDGVPVAYNEGLSQPAPILNGGNTYIGALFTNVQTATFSGVIDDVRLYNAALSTGAILDLFQGANVTGELEANIASGWTGAPWLDVPPILMTSTNDDGLNTSTNAAVRELLSAPPAAPATSCILQIVQ